MEELNELRKLKAELADIKFNFELDREIGKAKEEVLKTLGQIAQLKRKRKLVDSELRLIESEEDFQKFVLGYLPRRTIL